MFGGASSAAAAIDDPYANIALDLTKVTKSEPPAKLYEHKSEEEKKKDASSKSNTAMKSNLKKDFDKDDDKGKRKRGVSFGQSTTFEVDKIDDESGEFYNNDVREGKGSPRPQKVIEVKDLSDGRSEKEKIKEMLEKE